MFSRYGRKLNLPFVPGFEICGEVLEMGSNVTTLAVGSKVIGINKEGLGGYAEECIISEKVKLINIFHKSFSYYRIETIYLM